MVPAFVFYGVGRCVALLYSKLLGSFLKFTDDSLIHHPAELVSGFFKLTKRN